jgi:hypothetical protein
MAVPEENKEDVKPALLTRSEVDWLLGNRQFSKPYERKLKHGINKKLRTLLQIEVPLLRANGFNITIGCNAATASSNDPLPIAQSSSRMIKNDRLIQSIGFTGRSCRGTRACRSTRTCCS